MVSDDIVVVLESSLASRSVVIDIIVERLAEEVEVVELVESFDVCWEAAAVF